MFDWKGMLRRAWLPLAGLGAVGVALWALLLWAPVKALVDFSKVTSGASIALAPGVPQELPPSPSVPLKGRHRWHPAPPVPGAVAPPHLEPDKPADLAKLDEKLHLDGELGKSVDIMATGKLADGRELFALSPRNGKPGKMVVIEPTFHWGGSLALAGQALLDLKGKAQSGDVALLADLVRIGHLQVRAGPALIYDQQSGSRGGVLVRVELCLTHC